MFNPTIDRLIICVIYLVPGNINHMFNVAG